MRAGGRLIFPLKVYCQRTRHSGVDRERRWSRSNKFLTWPGFEALPLDWQSSALTTRPPLSWKTSRTAHYAQESQFPTRWPETAWTKPEHKSRTLHDLPFRHLREALYKSIDMIRFTLHDTIYFTLLQQQTQLLGTDTTVHAQTHNAPRHHTKGSKLQLSDHTHPVFSNRPQGQTSHGTGISSST